MDHDDTPPQPEPSAGDDLRERLAAFGLEPPPSEPDRSWATAHGWDADARDAEIDAGAELEFDVEIEAAHDLDAEMNSSAPESPMLDAAHRPIIPIDVLVPIVALGLVVLVLVNWLR